MKSQSLDKTMIIILEGPDGAGKTTLAKQLAEAFQLRIHHEGPPPKNVSVLQHYGRILDAARGQNVVFDRLYVGERVYGPIVRGEDRLGGDGYKRMRQLSWAVGALEILCLPSFEVCLTNWQNRKGELFADAAKLRQVHDSYRRYFTASMYLQYDFTSADWGWPWLRKTLEMVVPTWDSLPARMTGHPKATYLFVGDRGGDPDYRPDLPFFATSGSAQYLHNRLQDAGFDDSDVAFINSFSHETGKIETIPQTFQKVIALGLHADKICHQQGVQHVKIPHPQFWKRFHAYQSREYTKLLKGCQ